MNNMFCSLYPKFWFISNSKMKKTPPCTCWTQDEAAFDQIEGWVANPRRRYPSFIPCGQGAMACSNCSPTLAYPDHDRNSLTIFDPWSDWWTRRVSAVLWFHSPVVFQKIQNDRQNPFDASAVKPRSLSNSFCCSEDSSCSFASSKELLKLRAALAALAVSLVCSTKSSRFGSKMAGACESHFLLMP